MAQTTPLAALATKFGDGLPAGMLQADFGSTTLLVSLSIKFGAGLPDGMLLTDGGADKEALVTKFGGGLPAGMMWAGDNVESRLGRARARLLSEVCKGGHSRLSSGKRSTACPSTKTGGNGYGHLSSGEQTMMEGRRGPGGEGASGR